MDQLSRPYKIALVAMLVFAALWFVALRPGDDVEPVGDAPAPGLTGLGNAVEGADAAAAAANAATPVPGTDAATIVPATPPAAAPAPGAAPAPPATPAPPAPAATPAAPEPAPAAPATDPSRPILDALGRGKVAVLLFHETRGIDDKAVLSAVRSLSRRDGKVVVRSIPIGDLASYGAITRGVQILSAPTVLVVGSDKQARSIVGLTDADELDEVVDEVIAGPRAAVGVAPAAALAD